MKASIFLHTIAATISILGCLALSSCSGFDSYVEETSVPIDLEVISNLNEEDLPENAMSAASPLKVIGYKQECGKYSKYFEEEAYLKDGHLVFINQNHYWLTDRLMIFSVYWPADAEITTDAYGRITSGDCLISGHSVPMNPTLSKNDHTVSDRRLLLSFNTRLK